MATLTISSDAKLNGTAVAARFTTITIDDAHYPTSIQGHADLKDKPIAFTLQARGLNLETVDELGAIEASFVAREPRRTLGGTIDAVVNQGAELCHVEWDAAQEADGYLTVQAGVTGATESVIITLHPVDRLRFVGSTDYLEPDSGIEAT